MANTRTMPPKNAVNEFDEDRWTNAFNQMTAEKVSDKEDGSNVREAAEMVTNILDRMKAKYEGILDDLEENVDAFSQNVGELDTTLEDVKQTMNSG